MNAPLALFQSIALPLLALVVVVAVGWFAVVKLRSWMKDNAPSAQPFTLEDLRQLKRDDKLTEEEFEKARQMMIGSATRGPMPVRIKPHAPSVPPTTPDLRPYKAATPVRPSQLDEAGPPPSASGHSVDATRPPNPPKRPPQLD